MPRRTVSAASDVELVPTVGCVDDQACPVEGELPVADRHWRSGCNRLPGVRVVEAVEIVTAISDFANIHDLAAHSTWGVFPIAVITPMVPPVTAMSPTARRVGSTIWPGSNPGSRSMGAVKLNVAVQYEWSPS